MAQIGYKFSGIPLSRILSFISFKNMNFLILDCPTDNTLPQYLKEFKRNRVSDIVRVCEPTYNTELLSENNIVVHDWQFRDGAVPPNIIVSNWINLIEKKFGSLQQIRKMQSTTAEMNTENPTIAVHCVAGLGRAPVLVAIALIEAGMGPLQAIEHIRHYRRGAFNSVQLDYLDKYKRGQHTKKVNKFSIIKNRKDRSSMDNLKKGYANSNTKKSIFNHSKMNMTDISNKTGNETTTTSTPNTTSSPNHHNGIFSNINKIFKLRTTKSSPEVGVVN